MGRGGRAVLGGVRGGLLLSAGDSSMQQNCALSCAVSRTVCGGRGREEARINPPALVSYLSKISSTMC